MMKISIFVVLLLGLQNVASVMHSWKAFYTGTTGMSEFPEFVALNLLDDELMGYFDSKTNRFEGKQSWVAEKLGQEYVEQQTNVLQGHVPTFKANIGILMPRFNQSQGIHLWQRMYGCEWDDETGDIKGYDQFGYDGEDFVAFDLKSVSWIAPTPEAVITKNKWDNDKGFSAGQVNYYNQICPEWLKKYVNYGRRSLMRTVPPSVSLLQKSSSSPVTCYATGFYPNRAEMLWRKDGVEIHDGVEKGEIKPNNDGTFQMSVNIDLSSVATGDWNKYECVFQLSGLNEDLINELEKSKILTNESNFMIMIITIVAVVVVAVLVIAGVGYMCRERIKKLTAAKRPPTPIDDEVEKEMMPKDNGA